MKTKRQSTKQSRSADFVRRTVTVPAELDGFASERTNEPEHAGNFSSYVRSLIVRDRKATQGQPA